MPNLENYWMFIPETVIALAIIVLLCFSVLGTVLRLKSREDHVFVGLFSISTLVVAFIYELNLVIVPSISIFSDQIVIDGLSVYFKIIFIIISILVCIFSERSRELDFEKTRDAFEYYALILGVTLGMCLLASSRNLLMIYLSLEFIGLLSYLLTGYTKGEKRSSEAALKYILFGAVATGVFLFGASFFYGIGGSLDIMTAKLPSGAMGFVASAMILVGFLFKIAAVPMQAWCPDVYEGAPTPVAAFLSVGPKAAGFAVLIRFASVVGVDAHWPILIAIVSAVTMTFGNLAAIPQMNMKRLLAYSSIAQAGYMLIGVACLNTIGFRSVAFYFIAYIIMNLGAFLVIQIVGNKEGNEDIEGFKGLAYKGRNGIILSVSMTVFLLSLVGIPPFIGFVGKFYIFSAAIDSHIFWLAIIGILNSVVSLYYYMRIAVNMFFRQPAEVAQTPDGGGLMISVIFLASLTLLFGIMWNGLIQFVKAMI